MVAPAGAPKCFSGVCTRPQGFSPAGWLVRAARVGDRGWRRVRAVRPQKSQCNVWLLTKGEASFNTIAMTPSDGSSARLGVQTLEATMRTTLVVMFLALTMNLDVVLGQSTDATANNHHLDRVFGTFAEQDLEAVAASYFERLASPGIRTGLAGERGWRGAQGWQVREGGVERDCLEGRTSGPRRRINPRRGAAAETDSADRSSGRWSSSPRRRWGFSTWAYVFPRRKQSTLVKGKRPPLATRACVSPTCGRRSRSVGTTPERASILLGTVTNCHLVAIAEMTHHLAGRHLSPSA